MVWYLLTYQYGFFGALSNVNSSYRLSCNREIGICVSDVWRPDCGHCDAGAGDDFGGSCKVKPIILVIIKLNDS